METRSTMAHGVALATILVWGTTFIATKILLSSFTPIEILIIRFVMGYLGLAAFDLMKRGGRKEKHLGWNRRQELLFAGAGLTGVVMYYLLENFALTLTYASNVGILVSMAPLTTALLALFFLREERLKASLVTGFVIATIGAAMVMFNGTVKLQLSLAGDLLALASTVGWAVYSILLKKIDTENYAVTTYTRKIFFYGILFMVPFAYADGFSLSTSDFPPRSILLLMFLGLGASATCFVSWNHAVHVLGVFKTSAYIYLTPLVSLLTAALVLDEQVTGMAAIGCFMILTGLYVSERKAMPQRTIVPKTAL